MTRRNQLLPRARAQRPVFPDGEDPSHWFRITNLADAAQVHIYAEIGGPAHGAGIKAEAFCQEVAGIDASSIDVRLNSPGGDVFDGIAIFNALKNHPAQVNIHVDGLAASIASVIAMAGDHISMARGSQMMIHEGHTAAAGTAADMARTSELLNKCSDNIAAFYADRAGGTVELWRERMRAETWYSADEAVQAGLADEVAPTPARGLKASWDLSVFNYAGREYAPAPDIDIYNHPGHPDQSTHGRRHKRGVGMPGPHVPDVPNLPDKPGRGKRSTPAAPKAPNATKASPAKRTTPARRPEPALERRGPDFGRMDPDQIDQWFNDLTVDDWNKLSKDDQDAAWDHAKTELKRSGNGGNSAYAEILRDIETNAHKEDLRRRFERLKQMKPAARHAEPVHEPDDSWTALTGPLLTTPSNRDDVFAALREKL